MEINQASGDQSVRMSIQYDITMGNDVARMHIVTSPPPIGNDVTWDIHCDVTMNNYVAMCTYHDFTMHNDMDMNLYLYYELLCLSMLLCHG